MYTPTHLRLSFSLFLFILLMIGQLVLSPMANAAVAHVSTGSSASATGCGNISPGMPSGSTGDLLIALAIAKEDDNNNTLSMTGWQSYYAGSYSGAGNDNEIQAHIFWRIATSANSDPSTVSQSSSVLNSCSSFGASISRFSGVDVSNPFDTVSAGASLQDSGNLDTGSIMTASATAMLLVAGFISDNRSLSQPGSWTELFDFSYNQSGAKPDFALSLNSQLQTTAGNKSISNWDLSGTGNVENIGVIFALRPSGSGSGSNVVENGGELFCSTDTDKANINDIRFPGTGLSGGEKTYLETFILGQNVDVSNWQICYTFTGGAGHECVQLGQGNLNEYYYGNPQGDDASPASFNFGTYLEYPVPSSQTLNPNEGEVLLVNNINGTNVVIDYIQYCSTSTCTTPYWTVPPACGTTLANHDPDNKDIARLPDATGDFGDNGDDVTRGDTNDDTPPIPLAYYAMDETSWSGDSGDVIDSINMLNATSTNGAITADSDRAIPGSLGTCGYGSFDGENDYLAVPGFPDLTDSFTITAWINAKEVGKDQRIFADDEHNDNGYAFSLGDGGDGRLRFFSRSAGPGTKILDSNAVISANTWYFVTAVHDVNSKTMQIFVNGVSVATTTYNGTFGSDAGRASIGGETGTEGSGEATANWRFKGSIDELRVYNGALSSTRINQVKGLTHPCTGTGPDHYKISHDGNGLSCLAEEITINAHDSTTPTHGLVTVPAGTAITLNANELGTPSLRGSWSGIKPLSGTGSLTNNTAGSGTATYTFPGGESSVTLLFNYTNPILLTDTVNFNITDNNGITELKNISLVNEDPDLQFGTAAFIFNNDTDTNQTIPTQISGKNSNIAPDSKTLTVQAVKVNTTDPTQCEALFKNQTIAIELGAECRNPTTCAGQQLSINGSSIPTNADNGAGKTTTYSNPSINLIFNNLSKAPIIINYPDAGLMQLHARYNIPLNGGAQSGNYMFGSSNDFVVRPFGFAFTDIRNPGIDGMYGTIPLPGDDKLNPGGTAASGSGFIAAEDDFRASIQAYQYDAADDADMNGIPDIGRNITDNGNGITPNFAWSSSISAATTNFTPSGVGGVVGSITGNPLLQGSFSSGASTSGNLSYNNVGSITLQALATDYITPMGGINVYGYSMPVGRFFPDHFALITNSITPSCSSSFTYMGEPALSIDYELQAQGISNGATSNYDTTAGYNTGTIALRAENNSDGTDRGTRLSNAASVNNWSSGSYAHSTSVASFDRLASPDGPFQSLQLGLEITAEQDNRNITGLDMLTNSAKSFGTTDVRYGRLNLTNTFGSELLALNMPVTAQYYDSTLMGFVTNTADSCTTRTDLPAAAPTWGDITLPTANYSGNLAEGETTPGITGMLSAGRDTITLTAPGAGNDGSVTVNLAAPIWLQFDWDNNGTYTDDPSAIATFGIFHGNDATIYRRELY